MGVEKGDVIVCQMQCCGRIGERGAKGEGGYGSGYCCGCVSGKQLVRSRVVYFHKGCQNAVYQAMSDSMS